MIVSMLKYSFLVYHADYPAFLKDIKELGVVHIDQKVKEPTLDMQEMFRHISETSAVIKELKYRKSYLNEAPSQAISKSNGSALLEDLKSLKELREDKNALLDNYSKELRQAEPWGEFSKELLSKLNEKGISFRFLTTSIRRFEEDWPQKYPISVIGDFMGSRYYVLMEYDGEVDQEFLDLPSVDELSLPEKSVAELHSLIKKLKLEIADIDSKIDAIAWSGLPLIESYLEELKDQLTSANVHHQTVSEVDGKVSLVEGWVPQSKTEKLNKYLESNKILFVSREAEEDEQVPILLKNNRFNKLFEFIGSFYDHPNHKELDLTPFFAPFYMLFFGFALGDAGYGLILILGAALLKRKMPKLKSVLTLAQVLGGATVVFGALTGTFFGISLVEADIPWLENVKAFMVDTDQLFYLAIILGVIQILFGMVVKVVNISISQGFKYSFSTIGWLILLIGSSINFGIKQLGLIDSTLMGNINIGIFSISGILILLLNNPKRNIFMNFLVGLWDVYGMLTGLLGDILSYIRLFALGVSSAILGSVFNMMAMNMKPDNIILGPLVMIIILVLGHGITIFMSALGAFVHPIRLTFVEFYKNAGFEGGGKPYLPFAKESNKN